MYSFFVSSACRWLVVSWLVSYLSRLVAVPLGVELPLLVGLLFVMLTWRRSVDFSESMSMIDRGFRQDGSRAGATRVEFLTEKSVGEEDF